MTRIPSYSTLVIVALVAALVGSYGADRLEGQAAGGLKPPTVALINVQKVINQLDERKKMEADLQVMAGNIQKDIQERQAEIKAIQSDMAIMNPETEAYQAKQNEGLKLTYEFEAWQKLTNAQAERERGIMLESLYNKVIAASKAKAEKDGIDLVLTDDQSGPLKVKSQQAVLQMMSLRKVIYAKDWLVMTDQVAQQMNNEFNLADPTAQ
jgi:Skp family chaperone for outer membrane proteins